MAVTFRTDAIPLVTRAVRETDRVYSVLTETHGKLDLYAKGSRKIVSKLAGEMETPGVLDLFVVRGRAFDRLAGAAPVRSYPAVRDSFERMHAALAARSFLDRATRTGERDRALFALLEEYLATVAAASEHALADGRLSLAFQWKVFARLGFRPDLERCVRCRTEVAAAEGGLTVRHGGLVCAACRAAGSVLDAAPVAPDTRKVLAFLLDAPFAETGRLFLAPPLRATTAALTEAWSRMHLEMEPMRA